MPPAATRRYVSSILTSDFSRSRKEVESEMLQEIGVPKILTVLHTPEYIREIPGGILRAGPNNSANLIFKLQHAFSEV